MSQPDLGVTGIPNVTIAISGADVETRLLISALIEASLHGKFIEIDNQVARVDITASHLMLNLAKQRNPNLPSTTIKIVNGE